MSTVIFGIIAILLYLILAFLVLVVMARGRFKMKKVHSVLFAVAGIGAFLFFAGSYLASIGGSSESLYVKFVNSLYAVLRGIFNTLRMFTFIDNTKDLATDNTMVRLLFWLFHVLALFAMQVAILTLFGRKWIANLRLLLGLHNEVYILKGCDKYSLVLGENIATKDNPRNPPVAERLVVFLVEEDDDARKINEKVAHFGGIVKVLDRQNDIGCHLGKAGLGRPWLKKKHYNVILMPGNVSVPDDARRVAEYAKAKGVADGTLDVFVFATSEWDREHIETLTREQKGEKDGETFKYPCTFHIIGEMELLVRKMIEEHPPYRCPGLKFSETGVAERGFTVMILGFDRTGQQALLRLMMNGQFLTRDGSRMRAVVVDRETKHLRKRFEHCHPSLNLCCDMKFLDYDVRNEAFFNLLDEGGDVDYIVVALNSNDANKQVALDIRRSYQRKGATALPVIAVSEKNEGVHEAEYGDGIFVFGCREAIYKDSVIIREETDRRAKAVNEAYREMYHGGEPWHGLDWFTQESNRAAADFIPAMLRLANNMDEPTAIAKGTLAPKGSELAENLAQTEHLRWNAFHAAMGFRAIAPKEMRLRFENPKDTAPPLVYARKCVKERLHACLVPWNELDNLSTAYNDLERQSGKDKLTNFKNDDRNIVENIPKFLSGVKGKE